MGSAASEYAPSTSNFTGVFSAMNVTPYGQTQRSLSVLIRRMNTRHQYAQIAVKHYGTTPVIGQIFKKFVCSDGTIRSKSLERRIVFAPYDAKASFLWSTLSIRFPLC